MRRIPFPDDRPDPPDDPRALPPRLPDDPVGALGRLLARRTPTEWAETDEDERPVPESAKRREAAGDGIDRWFPVRGPGHRQWTWTDPDPLQRDQAALIHLLAAIARTHAPDWVGMWGPRRAGGRPRVSCWNRVSLKRWSAELNRRLGQIERVQLARRPKETSAEFVARVAEIVKHNLRLGEILVMANGTDLFCEDAWPPLTTREALAIAAKGVGRTGRVSRRGLVLAILEHHLGDGIEAKDIENAIDRA